MPYGIAPSYLTVNESVEFYVASARDPSALQPVGDGYVGLLTDYVSVGFGGPTNTGERISSGDNAPFVWPGGFYGVLPVGESYADRYVTQFVPEGIDGGQPYGSYFNACAGFGGFDNTWYGLATFGGGVTYVAVNSASLFGSIYSFTPGTNIEFSTNVVLDPANDLVYDFGEVNPITHEHDIRTIRFGTVEEGALSTPTEPGYYAQMSVTWKVDADKIPLMPLWFVGSDGTLTPYDPVSVERNVIPGTSPETNPPPEPFSPTAYQWPPLSGNYLSNGDNLYDIGLVFYWILPPDAPPPVVPVPVAASMDEYSLRGAVALVEGGGSPRLYAIGCHTKSTSLKTYSLRQVSIGPYGLQHGWIIDEHYEVTVQSSDLVAVMSKDFGTTWEKGVPVGLAAIDGSDASNGRMSYGTAYLPGEGASGGYDLSRMVNTHIVPLNLIITPSGTIFVRAYFQTRDPFGVLLGQWTTDTFAPRLCMVSTMQSRDSVSGSSKPAFRDALTPNQAAPQSKTAPAIYSSVQVWQPAGAYHPAHGSGGQTHGPGDALYALNGGGSENVMLVSEDGGDTWTLDNGFPASSIGYSGGRDSLIPVCSPWVGKQDCMIEGGYIGASESFGLAPGQPGADADTSLRWGGSYPCGAADTYIGNFGRTDTAPAGWWVGHEYCGFSYENPSLEPRYGHFLPLPPNGPALSLNPNTLQGGRVDTLFWHWQGRFVCMQAPFDYYGGSGPGITTWVSDDEGRTMTKLWRSMDCLRTWQKAT